MNHKQLMWSQNSFKQSLFVFGIVWIVWFSISILFLKIIGPTNNIVYTRTSATANTWEIFLKEINPGFPIRLKITKIKVDAPIKQLGMTPSGEMDTTKGPDDVAWFKLGSIPWKKWSSVIAGHYWERKNGAISVFHDLNKLVKWDKLVIENDNWKLITFVVRESKIYHSTDNTSEVFISNDGKSHLNLITCDGVWDKIAKTYHQRLVIFTDKE